MSRLLGMALLVRAGLAAVAPAAVLALDTTAALCRQIRRSLATISALEN